MTPVHYNSPTYGEARSQLLADIAARLGKPVMELRGWEDYDPVTVDEAAHNMSKGRIGVVWTGD